MSDLYDLADLPLLAHDIVRELEKHWDRSDLPMMQVWALAEESGEFVGAARRFFGYARRTGPFADVESELADVVVTAFVTAHVLGINLADVIDRKSKVMFSRPWKDPR